MPDQIYLSSIDVNLSDSSITPGGSFVVGVIFRSPDSSGTKNDVLIEVEVDGVLVDNRTHSITFTAGADKSFTLSSQDFQVGSSSENDVWTGNLMNYDCDDDHTITVTVSGGVSERSDSTSFSIQPGDDIDRLSLSYDPSAPGIDEDVIVRVRDDDGDIVKSADVKFTWIDDTRGITKGAWDYKDRGTGERSTDNNGEVIFNLVDDFREEYGKYQIDAYKNDYCKATETLTFSKGTISLGDPEPANPKVGEQFRIRVLNSSGSGVKGARGLIAELNIKSTSDADGYLRFTINQEGTYTLLVNVTNYGEFEMQVMVSTTTPLIVVVTPSSTPVNSPVTILVSSNDVPVQGASLSITRSGVLKSTLSTGSDGTASYKPDQSGSYTVTASKQGYSTAVKSFDVGSSFKIQITPEDAKRMYGSDVTLTVLDAETNTAVSSALVSVNGILSSTNTNVMGQFTLKLSSSGQYLILVSKEGYSDKEVSVTALCSLKLRVNVTAGVQLGQAVGITVYDEEKRAAASGNIGITKPDGSSETKVDDSYVLIPAAQGAYRITLSKANCVGDEVSLSVGAGAVKFESELSDDNLTVRVVSGVKPVSGVVVTVTIPNGTTVAATSDSGGMININAFEAGNYTIELNDSRYSGEGISVEKKVSIGLFSSLGKYWWVILVVLIAGIIIVLLLLAVFVFMRSKGGRSDSSFRSGRSSLHR